MGSSGLVSVVFSRQSILSTPQFHYSHTVQILTPSDSHCISAGPDANGAPVTIQACTTPSSNGNTTWVIPANGQTGTISTFAGGAGPAQCLDVTNGVNA